MYFASIVIFITLVLVHIQVSFLYLFFQLPFPLEHNIFLRSKKQNIKWVNVTQRKKIVSLFLLHLLVDFKRSFVGSVHRYNCMHIYIVCYATLIWPSTRKLESKLKCVHPNEVCSKEAKLGNNHWLRLNYIIKIIRFWSLSIGSAVDGTLLTLGGFEIVTGVYGNWTMNMKTILKIICMEFRMEWLY